MLTRIFRSFARKKWEDPDPTVRRNALPELKQSSDGAGVLKRIAENDADDGVRSAAIALLDDSQALLALTESKRSAEAAWRRLALLVSEKRVPLDLFADTTKLLTLLKATTSSALADFALQRLDTNGLVEAAIEAGSAALRVRAAEQVHGEVALTELARRSRGRDKTVHRMARERLDQRRHLINSERSLRDALQQLRAKSEQLRHAQSDPLFAPRLEHAQQQLAELQANVRRLQQEAKHHTDYQVPALGTVDIAQTLDEISTHLKERAVSPVTPAAVASDVPDPDRAHAAALEEATALLQQVQAQSDTVLNEHEQIGQRLEACQTSWYRASDAAAPEAAHADEFQQTTRLIKDALAAAERWQQAAQARATLAADLTAESNSESNRQTPPYPPVHDHQRWQQLWHAERRSQRLARVAGDMLQRLHWPNALPTPQAVAEVAALAQRCESFGTHCVQALDHLQSQLTARLDDLARAIEQGVSRDAYAQLNEARRISRCLPSKAGAGQQGRLAHLAAQVQTLRDWQDFATHPKRESLCADMEQLAATELDPESKADRIKQLRADWQALGPITSGGERVLVDRFNHAADQAFEPCRVYFDELARVRHHNLQERQRVADTLAEYLDNTDWQKADWKTAQQVLRIARTEFLSFTPVERGAGRELMKRFNGLADRLFQLIKDEWDRNLKRKHDIVDEATAIVGADAPLAEKIERIKSLQHHWRAVGVTPRRPDQKLWNEFRQAADSVFGARELEHTEQQRTVTANAKAAEALCAELEQLAAGDGAITDRGAVDELAEQLRGIELPAETARRIQRRFRDGEQSFLQRLREHQFAARRGQLLKPLHISDALAELERAGSVPSALPDWWDEAKTLGMSARLAALQGHAPALDDAGALQARRRIVALAEIAAGVESPPAEKALRMELQMSRLKQVGTALQSQTPDAAQFIRDWACAGPERDHAQTRELRMRFDAAIERWLS